MSRRAIARRELRALSREKTIVLAVLIQVVIAGFSSFLVVGLTSMYDPSADAETVAVGVTGEEADRLVAAAREVEGLSTVTYDDRSNAAADFESGAVDALARVESREGRLEVSVEVPRTGLEQTLVVVQLRAALEELERAERLDRAEFLGVRPLPVPGPVDASPYFGFSYTVLLPILVFLPAFISGAVVVDSVTEEIERGTLTLLRVTPASLVQIIEGKAGLLAALVPTQVLAWLLLLELNGIDVSNPLSVLVVAAAAAVLAVCGAAGLAVLVRVRQRAQLTYSFGALAAFIAAAALPEHPATTVGLLAIDSATRETYLLAGGYALAALAAAALLRAWLEGVDAERLE